MKRSAGRMALSQVCEEPLQITVPKVTKKSLKIRAAESGVTMRVIVLKSLAAAGIHVPQSVLQDRRKGQEQG